MRLTQRREITGRDSVYSTVSPSHIFRVICCHRRQMWRRTRDIGRPAVLVLLLLAVFSARASQGFPSANLAGSVRLQPSIIAEPVSRQLCP